MSNDLTVKIMRAGTQIATGIYLQRDNMSVQEAVSFGGKGPYERFWGYTLTTIDVQQFDKVVDLVNIDPKTSTNTQYRVINIPEPFPDQHMEIALDLYRGD